MSYLVGTYGFFSPASLEKEKRRSLLIKVKQVFISCLIQASAHPAERNCNNSASTNVLVPLLNSKFFSIRPRDFFEVVKAQHDRYKACFSSAQVMQLVKKFQNMKRYIVRCKKARSKSEQFKICSTVGEDVFGKAWSSIGAWLSLLFRLYGGLETVFRGISTVESDVLALQWEKCPLLNAHWSQPWRYRSLKASRIH